MSSRRVDAPGADPDSWHQHWLCLCFLFQSSGGAGNLRGCRMVVFIQVLVK